MNGSNFILFHWRNESLSFHKNLAILKKKADKNATHDLRVAIKKLRSYLRLFFLLTDINQNENLLLQSETLFKVLGKQRDVEICLEVLKKYKKPNAPGHSLLKKQFEHNLKQTVRWSRKQVKNYQKKELAAIGILIRNSGIKDEIALSKTSKIIEEHLIQCRGKLKIPHKLRQQLKEIYYWIKLLPADHFLNSVEKKLHDILDDLGSWQDHQVFITQAKHFRKDFVPKSFPEYENIKTLQTMSAEKAEELLRSGIQKTRSLLRIVSSKTSQTKPVEI